MLNSPNGNKNYKQKLSVVIRRSIYQNCLGLLLNPHNSDITYQQTKVQCYISISYRKFATAAGLIPAAVGF